MACDAKIWQPLYGGDFLKDVQRHSNEFAGVFVKLQISYWQDGPLPDDDEALRRIVSMDRKDWKAMRPSIERLFVVADGVWRNPVLDKEYAKALKNVTQKSIAGKASGRVRRAKKETAAQTTVQTAERTHHHHHHQREDLRQEVTVPVSREGIGEELAGDPQLIRTYDPDEIPWGIGSEEPVPHVSRLKVGGRR
ncbi:MAG TPA: DUF1376 domain-containing protein [Rhodospirillaceae bacterium]|nr:DUF1376 domain-containing protein [Rhodospirillaceae bacterium]